MTEDSFPPITEPLDPGIEPVVMLLRKHGVRTTSSCQGHADRPGASERYVAFEATTWQEVDKACNVLSNNRIDWLDASLYRTKYSDKRQQVDCMSGKIMLATLKYLGNEVQKV